MVVSELRLSGPPKPIDFWPIVQAVVENVLQDDLDHGSPQAMEYRDPSNVAAVITDEVVSRFQVDWNPLWKGPGRRSPDPLRAGMWWPGRRPSTTYRPSTRSA